MANGQGVFTPTRPVTQDQRPEKLNAACRLLLLLLERYQGKNDHAWPGIRRLSEEMGVSRRYCQQCLRKLEQGRWIACKARWRSDGSQTSNAYWVLDKPTVEPANQLREKNPRCTTENPASSATVPAVSRNAELLQSPRASTQTNDLAVNSRSFFQLSSSRQSGQAHTGANNTTHQEHSSNHQSKKHGKNVSLKNGGWTGGGIKKEDFATKTEARKRYEEAVQRGYVDQSFNTKLNFFCCWAGVVRLLKAGEVVEPGAYFTHLLKNNLTGVFATLADEDHVKKSKIMQE